MTLARCGTSSAAAVFLVDESSGYRVEDQCLPEFAPT
jgi:hypothetical protein